MSGKRRKFETLAIDEIPYQSNAKRLYKGFSIRHFCFFTCDPPLNARNPKTRTKNPTAMRGMLWLLMLAAGATPPPPPAAAAAPMA